MPEGKDHDKRKENAQRTEEKPQGEKPTQRGREGDPSKKREGTREVRPGGHEPGTERGPKPKRPQAATAKGGSR